MNQLVIANTEIFNPSLDDFEEVNIGIKDGKINRLSENSLTGERVLDVEGLFTAPGFIDIHAHEDNMDTENMTVKGIPYNTERALRNMGVTTMVGGNCGISAFPIDSYLERVNVELDVNYLTYIGHSTLRKIAGVKDRYRAASQNELNKMIRLAREALVQGAIGVSFGLEYEPGSSRQEVRELTKIVGEQGGLIAAHVRYDSVKVLQGIKEIAAVGENYEVPVQISHLGSMASFGYMRESIEYIEKMREEIDIMADSYPYYAFCTSIGSAVFDSGFLEKWNADYSDIEIGDGPHRGERCDERLFHQLREEHPDTSVVAHVLKEDEVRSAIEHPLVVIGSDGSVRGEISSHPRVAGTFPKIFQEYVREGSISLEEAIRKTSTQTAYQLGLYNKGSIVPGQDADLVIFDPKVIRAKATYKDTTRPPVGIEHVICGGKEVPICNR